MDVPSSSLLIQEGPNWAEVATGIGTVALAIATVFLVFAGLRQLRLLREQEAHSTLRQREWETMRACQLYDIDPVLDAASNRIHSDARGGDPKATPDYKKCKLRDALTLLNYLDGLAIGVRQGLYEEHIVRDQLTGAVALMVDKIGPGVEYPKASFKCLNDLHEAWSNSQEFYKSPKV